MRKRQVVDAVAAYDKYAPHYNDVTTRNMINAYMRARSLDFLKSAFARGQRVLDIGCGTGEETIVLASAGIEVVAVDASEKMLNVLEAKLERRGLSELVTPVRLRSSEIASMVSQFGEGSFDGAYASFSLSYEKDLKAVVRGLARLLKPGSLFLCSVFNRLSLSELVISLLALHPALAGRRLRERVLHKVGGRYVSIYARAPQEFLEKFRPAFRPISITSFPIVIPPPYFNALYERLADLHEVLVKLDLLMQRSPLVRCLGDHLHFTLRKSEEIS